MGRGMGAVLHQMAPKHCFVALGKVSGHPLAFSLCVLKMMIIVSISLGLYSMTTETVWPFILFFFF
jgi:hypothetical protein